jgi:chromosome segregation ATPase
MHDAVLRNVSLQTNLRISEEVIKEQNEKIQELESIVENLKSETIGDLQDELEEFKAMRSQYENVKHQVQHLDTFRNELVRERDEHQKTRVEYEIKIQELTKQLEDLQTPPKKKKNMKLDKTTMIVTSTDDGGTF